MNKVLEMHRLTNPDSKDVGDALHIVKSGKGYCGKAELRNESGRVVTSYFEMAWFPRSHEGILDFFSGTTHFIPVAAGVTPKEAVNAFLARNKYVSRCLSSTYARKKSLTSARKDDTI